MAIRARVPAGAESLDPYIAGESLSLRLDVAGDLDDLEPGDAVVLEYVAELDGLPAIFIPLVALLAGLIVFLVAAWRGVPAAARRYREAAERRRQTEAYAFAQLCKVMDSGNSEAAYRAMLRWAERLGPGMNLRTFAATYGDESLLAAISALSAGIYGNAGSTGGSKEVTRHLKAARKRYLERAAQRQASTLPPLNPT